MPEIRQDDRRLMSRRQAAHYLGLSLRKFDEMLAAGVVAPVRLPAVRRRTLVDRLDLDALIAAGKNSSDGGCRPGDPRRLIDPLQNRVP